MTLGDDFRDALGDDNRATNIGEKALRICLQAEKQYRFAYIDGKELRYYKNGWYQRGGEDFVTKELQKVLPDISQHLLSETIAKLSQRNYQSLEDYDSDKNVRNVENGLLDLDKMRLRPHTPEYLSIVQYPIRFEAKPKSKRIRKLLAETLDEKELRKLMMALGDIFVKGYPYQTIFFLVGAGHNRKGLVARLIKKMVGRELFCSVNMRTVADSRFAKAELFGKVVNISGDDSPTSLDNWNVIRSLAGDDTILAERKGQQYFQFVNEAKLFFIFNKLPSIDEDYSTWRRIQLIKFAKDFSDKDDGKNSDVFEASLHTPECMSELLFLALKGRKMLLKNGGHDKEDINAIKLEYKKMQDHIIAFLDECYNRQADGGYTEVDTVYYDYCDYCEKHSETALPKNEFGSRLADNNIPNRKRGTGKNRPHCYVGIVPKKAGFFEDG
jgi:putative DNA primase/helicase